MITGMHTISTRQEAFAAWKEHSNKVGLRGVSGGDFSVQSAVDPAQLRQWHRMGLPKDTACIQNAVLTSLSVRWPLLVDPHGVARKWIKGTERANQLRMLLPTQHDFVRALENAVATGRVVFIDNAVGDDGQLPSVLDDLLRPIANSPTPPHTVRIVNEVNYNKKFKYVNRGSKRGNGTYRNTIGYT
jgi:ATP-binding dynein motor region